MKATAHPTKHRDAPARCAYNGPLGPMTLAAHNGKVCGIWFDGQKHQPDLSAWPNDDAHPALVAARAQLDQYFAGKSKTFDLPLNLQAGTPFQQSVWMALLGVPAGQTLSYGQLASAIGKPAAVRAVGAAVGRNPVSVVVPCHRIVGSDGALTGYAGGIDRKAALLALEGPHSGRGSEAKGG
jgi:methylated-DNA-[protein]-cysteine S-methyltransferase